MVTAERYRQTPRLSLHLVADSGVDVSAALHCLKLSKSLLSSLLFNRSVGRLCNYRGCAKAPKRVLGAQRESGHLKYYSGML